jgi:hypothetical protein
VEIFVDLPCGEARGDVSNYAGWVIDVCPNFLSLFILSYSMTDLPEYPKWTVTRIFRPKACLEYERVMKRVCSSTQFIPCTRWVLKY